MSLQPGTEPIAADEILYRRVPVSTGVIRLLKKVLESNGAHAILGEK
jgi:hypothetical protein